MDLNPLRESLTARDWRAADEETGRLLLVDGDEGGFAGLEPHEIQGLDCALLVAIDNEWLAASGGRFGFTPQVELLAAVRADGLAPSSVWQAFGIRTGWVTDDGWASDRDRLTHSLDAPAGHLPWFPATFPTVATGRTFEVLFWFYDHFRGCVGTATE